MKVALYKHIRHGFESVWEADKIGEDVDYVRISLIEDIQFIPRPVEELVPEQIKSLDGEREKIVARFNEELQRIDQRRANLLALTQPTGAV